MRSPKEGENVTPSVDIKPILPAWITAPCRLLAWAIVGISVVMALTMSEQAVRGHAATGMVIAVGVVPLMLFLTVLGHEMGHAIGAWRAGMKVLTIHAGPLEMKPGGGAYRWRFSRPKGSVGGLTMAFPDVGRPIRPAMMCFILGGPTANLIVAALTLIPAWLLAQPLSGLFAAFALINAAVGIANALPHGGKSYASDGLQFVAWYKRWRDDSPELAYLKFMGLSVFGTTADELPPGLVAQLDEQGPIMRLVAAWIRLKASQNRHSWPEARRIETDIEGIVESLPQAYLAALKEMLVVLRMEIAFSRSIEERSADPIGVFRFDKGVDWVAPHLRPRFAALKASLNGDGASAELHLAEMLRVASSSPDLALHKSESRIMIAIRALNARGRHSNQVSELGQS